jgi:NitT/TauT family transport system permease protein
VADAVATSNGPRASRRRFPWPVLLPLAFLTLWTLAVHRHWVVEGIIPSPVQVVQSWYWWIFGLPTRSMSPYSGTWVAAVLYSSRRVLQGFLLASLVGIPLGLFVGWNRLVAGLFDSWISGAFYPIVVNTTHGVRDTNLLLLRAARMMGAGESTILTKVVFRSALPSIFTGLRLGIGIAWTAVIVAEMIAVKSGLGYVLWDAYYVGRMDICVATMLSVGLLGFVSDRVLQLLAHVLLRWRTLEAHA